jgi:hypothetical protein
MGLTVRIENKSCEKIEDIEEIGDPHNLLHRLLPSEDDTSFQCLRFIDWYGDTTFNSLQIRTFLIELERITQNAETNDEKELLNQIKNLAKRVSTHTYLKFIGD